MSEAQEPPLQERVVRDVDTRREVAEVERRLLGLREEVVRVVVEDHPPDDRDRHLLLGDDLGRVEHVELELLEGLLGEQLHAQLPLG